MIGIYAIYWPNSIGTVYIGQSIDIEKRFKTHCSLLEKREHYNYKLQSAYLACDSIKPQFLVLEHCLSSELDDREIYWISEFDSINTGYNITSGGDGGRGLNHANSKYSKFTLLRTFVLLYRTLLRYREISEKVGIPLTTVHNIASGTHHLWLKDQYPDEFSRMLRNKRLRAFNNAKTIKNTGKSFPPIMSPIGEVHVIDNISEFCRTHPLLKNECDSTRSSIGKVLKGTKPSHKGWKLMT